MSATLAIAVRPSYAQTQTVNSGVAIPLYNYPDSTWTTIINIHKQYPNVPIAAIVNPNNGPGSSKDPNYVTGIQNFKANGIMVLGYVDMLTGGGTLPAKTVAQAENQVNEYLSWYGVNGIFFDDMNNGFTDSPSTYSTLNTYTKSLGMTYTMGNPGTGISSSYMGTFDNLVIYESSSYPPLSALSYPGYSNSHFTYVAYGVSYNAAFVTSSAADVAYMYIDNLSGGNPYSTLSSFFAQNVATLSLVDTIGSTSTTSSSTTATSTTKSTTTSSTTSGPVSIKVRSVNLAGVSFTGMWITVSSSTGALLQGGYTTFTYNALPGASYTVCVFSYGTTVFSHWGNGNTGACRVVTPSSNIVLTAYYG